MGKNRETKATRVVPVSCNKDCGGGCPLLAHVEDGRLVRITDNPSGTPYMVGCVRGYQMGRVVYAPDRVLKPLLRVGPRGSGQFKEIAWREALDYAAERLAEIKARYGCQAIIKLGGSGSCRGALHNTSRLTTRFLGLFGGYTGTYGSYSSAATGFATPYVLGTTQAGLDPATLQFSKMIILWGANIADTRFGCELEARIREAKERGTALIVIDPRRSRSVTQLGAEWIPVWPGTDTALMAAVLYVLLGEGLVDRAFIERYSVGFEALERYVLGAEDGVAKSPSWAERICGTPQETIVAFARRYGRAKPAALIPGLSIQRTLGGEEAARMAIALQVATGNFGQLGGSSGANIWGRLPTPRCGAMPIPPLPAQPAVPTYRWPDAILEGRAGGYPTEIKAIYNVGGNYLSQGSDIRKNIRAFNKVEFAICHDYALTPTARYCDLVLPTTTFLEREDIVFPAGNYLLYSHQAIDPLPEAKNDYDIFCELAERLGFLEEFSEHRTAEQWLDRFLAESEVPDQEAFKRTGIYMAPDQMRVGLAEFVADPEGHPLQTPSGKIEIASARYAATGFSAFPTCRIAPAEEGYPLRLITPHPRYRTHSQYDNIPWFKEREPQRLWIHPADAEARGIADGQPVYVRSPQGQVRVPAWVTDQIMPGVVCLLEGVWPQIGPDGVDVAGSPNMLTSTVPTEPSQGSRTHSVWVEVSPAPE